MKIVHAVLVCLLLSGCAPPPLPPLAEDDVVLAFGDSLTVGYGVSPGESYPAQLQVLINRQVVAAGVSGETTIAARKRLPQILRQVRPALVIICTGGNDFLRKISEKVTTDNIEQMIKTIRGVGVQVVLVSVPRASLWKSNHPLYERVAAAYDLWIEDDILKTVLHNPSLKSDQLHPNARGYRMMAEAIADLLQRAGAVSSDIRLVYGD